MDFNTIGTLIALTVIALIFFWGYRLERKNTNKLIDEFKSDRIAYPEPEPFVTPAPAKRVRKPRQAPVASTVETKSKAIVNK